MDNEETLGKLYHAYSLCLFHTLKKSVAIKYLKKALKYSRISKNNQLESEILNSIGKYYEYFNDFQNSLYYYMKSEETKVITEDEYGLAIVYGNLGRLYFQNGDLKEALNYYLLDLKISKELNDKFGIAMMHNHIGDIYFITNDFKQSMKNYKSSFYIGTEMNYELNNAFSMLGMAKIEIKQQHLDKAKEYIRNSVDIFNEKSKYDYELSKFYVDINQRDKSLDYIDKYFNINFNISNFENTMFQHIIELATHITNADLAAIMIRRENAIEIIETEIDNFGHTVIKREVIASWDEIHNNYSDETDNEKIKSILEIKLKKKLKDFYIEPIYYTSKIIGFTFIYKIKGDSFSENDKDYLILYNIKLANLIQSIISFEMSRYDPLTRAANRSSLFSDIQEEIFKTFIYGEAFAILMIDIDNFKAINDNFGHQLGDLALIKIVEIIRNNVRDKNKVYRFGGDEFFVILPATDIKTAETIAHRLLSNIRQINTIYNLTGIDITVSIGLTDFTGKNSDKSNYDIQGILKKVDQAMYDAKINGKNRVSTLY
jgi:diguanylate cyclase (GGDEF)-like protein